MPHRRPTLRPVACMVCGWSWVTGACEHKAPHCPKCKVGLGVQVMRITKPDDGGRYYVLEAYATWGNDSGGAG